MGVVSSLIYLLKQVRKIFLFLKYFFKRRSTPKESPKSSCSDQPNIILRTIERSNVQHSFQTPTVNPEQLQDNPGPAPNTTEEPQLNMSNDIEGLIPTFPKPSARYKERPGNYAESSCIEPLTLDFEPHPDIDGRWECHVHPYGKLYFRDQGMHTTIAVLTYAYLYKDTVRRIIDGYIEKIQQFIVENHLLHRLRNARTRLVLGLREDGRCGYYFVNHDKQYVFWLETVDIIHLADDPRVKVEMTVKSPKWEVRSAYWDHNILFPDDEPLQDVTIKAVKDWLEMYAGVLLTTSSNIKVSHFSLEEIEKFLSLVRNLNIKDVNDAYNEKRECGAVLVIYHLMSMICHNRFLDAHGQHEVCPLNEQPLYQSLKPPLPVRLVSVLFFAPRKFTAQIAQLASVAIRNRGQRVAFPQMIIREWQNYSLFGTVLLATSVTSLSHTPLVGFFISVGTSISAILSCLWLINNHDLLILVLQRRSTPIVIQLLSIVCCLPSGLTTWSVLAFTLSLAMMYHPYTLPFLAVYFIYSAIFLLTWGMQHPS